MSDKKTHWDNIYNEKSNTDVSCYQRRPDISLDLIHHAHIKLKEPIIDVGGGLSNLVEHLVEAGYSKLVVLDISANAIGSLRQPTKSVSY